MTHSAAHDYLAQLTNLLVQVEADLSESLETAAQIVADAFANDGLLHIFGTGHSHVLALELFYRAGGFANVNPILIPDLMLHVSASASSTAERETLDAQHIIASHAISSQDALLVISNSGGNQVTLDLARASKEVGVRVIALTSINHATSPLARSDSDKLHSVADVVLDNHGEVGDAVTHIEGATVAMGPTSTVIGAAIVNALAIRVAEILVATGHAPQVFTSANLAGGDAANASLIAKFSHRVDAL